MQLLFPDDEDTIEAQFMRFHADHPNVYRRLVALARILKERGHRHLGIGMLWETIRYEHMAGLPDAAETFKLNNNYRSRYARMIMAREADLSEIFELRELKTP